MVKLLGFDGGKSMVSDFIEDAFNQLVQDFNVVLWDGDWYNANGWTGIIEFFLEQKPNSKAVAFQSRAEVPGFHRSFWALYKKFPGRIQIVVLNDPDEDWAVCQQSILDRQSWLAGEFENGTLKDFERPNDDFVKWLTVAMISRKFQGETPVIAMNGGKITTALAALETGQNPYRKIQWTVYEAWRVDAEKEKKAGGTLVHYAMQHSNENLMQHSNENLQLELA